MRNRSLARTPKSLAVAVSVTGVCLCLLGWMAVHERRERLLELQRETELVTRQLSTRIWAGLEHHRIALQQTANFFRNSERVTEEEFYEFAASTLKLNRACLRLCYVDPSARIRWVHPIGANRMMLGFDLKSNPEIHSAVVRAQQSREPVISPPLRLIGGAEGFVMAVPLFRDGRFLGVVTGSFRTNDFLGAMAVQDVLERYEAIVTESGHPLFVSEGWDEARAPFQAVQEQFSLGGGAWVVRARPRDELLQARLAAGRLAFWALGGLAALALGFASGAWVSHAGGVTRQIERQSAELQQTRRRLDGTVEQLIQAEKMSALGELVAGVAHEINNPLCSILGYSQLLMAREVPADVRKRLETMHSEAERMAKIVSNLLTFARKHPAEKKRLGLNGIIDKTLELKAYQLKTGRIKVEKDLAADLPMTMLDFHQMQQVLLNLLNNAEQAIAESGERGTVRITTLQAGGRIEMRVADDGPGIPRDIQERIFEPFFTTKKEGRGTGLGLSLCYGIVREHGGTIRVESQAGQGATLVIELPIVGAGPDALEDTRAASVDAVPRLRVLVIDDEPALQDLLIDMLTARGHAVDTASDAPEALKKIAARRYDLIITDMKMPHGSGRDIYQAVVERYPELAGRIVFTSGDGASSRTLEFVRDVGNELVLKPFKVEQIERAIATAIRG